MNGWDNFFVAQAGAAAAFAGLVLVSISVNLERIVKSPGLVGRSAEPLVVLFTLFVSASLILIPDQAAWVYGVELLIVALAFSAVTGTMLFKQKQIKAARTHGDPAPRHSFASRVALCSLTGVFLSVAGLLVSFGHPRGLYSLVPAMILGFLLAFLDAWVLLIEIDR